MSSNYAFQSYDLDLDKLNQTQDPGEIVNMVGSVVDADNDFKIFPARTWIENFLYYAGQRDTNARFAAGTVSGNQLLSNMYPQGGNGMAPTSRRRISKTFKAVQIQAANATRQRPSIKVWPESDDEQAVKKAKLANIIVDYLWDIDCEDDLNYEAMLWALLTPAVARKDYLDFSFNKSRIQPVMDTILGPNGMPARDPMTGAPMQQLKMDQQGNPVVAQLPWNKSELVPAFRLMFNPSASWTTGVDWAGDIQTPRIGWIEDNYNQSGPGYHPENLDKVKKGIFWKFTPIMAMESAIKQLTFGAFRAYRNWNYTNSNVKDAVTFVNVFVQPSRYYPHGREIAIANGEVLYDGDSRAYRATPMNWHPYSFLCYERVPGRLWGTTYAEKITDINRAYEQARTEFDHLRRTFTKPKMLLPIGAQIDRDTILGDEQCIRYNPYAANGGEPKYLAGSQPPSTIMDDTKLTASEFTEISGVTEIMQGIRPQGVTTYRGLEVLREEANNSASNLIRMYENFIQASQTNKLHNIKACMITTDPTLVQGIKIFKKMNQYITDIDIQDFLGDDLAGFVKIESMSSIGKSKLATQEKLMSMAQMGVLGDIANDPDLNNEFKRKMDMSGFDKPANKHVTYARWENEMMLSADKKGMPINPPVLPWQDDTLHIREVEFLLNDPTVQSKVLTIQSLIMHRQAHLDALAQKMAQQMQQAMQQQAMQAPNPGQPGQGGPQHGAPHGQPSPHVTPGQGQQGVMFGPETGFGGQGQ